MMSNPFPPQQTLAQTTAAMTQPYYGDPSQQYRNVPSTTAMQAWLFNQSGMVVILSLGLLGVWWVGRDHLLEFKAIRAEEKANELAERKEFRDALKECCRESRAVANETRFGSGL